MLKVSEFLKWDTNAFVLGSFFSRFIGYDQGEKSYFYTYSDFRRSKYLNEESFDFEDYVKNSFIEDLNSQSWPKNWKSTTEIRESGINVRKYKAIYIVENDLNISEKSFFNKIYFKVLTSLEEFDGELTDSHKKFLRGFLEQRGSVDTSAGYLSQDYYYRNNFELKKARILTERLGVPTNVLNLNFRQLQNQYRVGINRRNTQLRIDLHWYAHYVGFINKFKAELYAKVYENKIIKNIDNVSYFQNKISIQSDNINTQFSKSLDIYADHIYMRELDETDIDLLRRNLGLEQKEIQRPIRDNRLKELFNELSEDVCYGCRIRETSTNPRTGRQNFHIHHYIPVSNDPQSLDTMDNLVKLCPTCHDSLTRGRSTIEDQTNLCYSIIQENPSLYEFASSYFNIDSKREIAIKTQKMLK